MLACYSLNATAQLDSMDCTGAVGDVKWSILSTGPFQSVNGDCWVLMDGQTLPNDSKLKAIGIGAIPNGQGKFLRAMDLRRENREDPGRPFGTAAGSYQEDALKSHDHTYTKTDVITDPPSEFGFGFGSRGGGPTYTETKTGRSGNYETRPKNIALYLYIRIN